MKKLSVSLFALIFLTIGCGESSSTTTSTNSPVSTTVESDQGDAIGVLLAVLHIYEGDVEQAVADGQITAVEAGLAFDAIQNKTLNQWVSLANQ